MVIVEVDNYSVSMMVLVEHTVCKSSATVFPKTLLLWTGLTWSNSGKMDWLNNKQVLCI